jgi:hypothetical protein
VKGVVDTSVLIAAASGEAAVPSLPDEVAISVMTIAELHRGAVAAPSPVLRHRRTQTLIEIERAFEALPVDRDVATAFAELVARSRRTGRRPHVIDGLIAATAVVHDVPVYTRDADFDHMPGVDVRRV